MDFLQGGNEQMCDFHHLSESKACDWTGALVQCQSFTVTVPSDVPFGQNHAAICKACETSHISYCEMSQYQYFSSQLLLSKQHGYQ